MLLGDVVVCPAVAAEQAPTHAGTLDDELALLVVHGVLHVLGHDHAEPDETLTMRPSSRSSSSTTGTGRRRPGSARQHDDWPRLVSARVRGTASRGERATVVGT